MCILVDIVPGTLGLKLLAAGSHLVKATSYMRGSGCESQCFSSEEPKLKISRTTGTGFWLVPAHFDP